MSAEALNALEWAWGSPHCAPEPIDQNAIVAAEKALGHNLPKAYKEAILNCGLPNISIDLLDFICDHEIDLADLSEFHSPQAIVSSTEGWREAGMPKHLIAFASDCSGNQFCFKTKAPESLDGVWFWDHDFDTVELVAASFEAWLKLYTSLKK